MNFIVRLVISAVAVIMTSYLLEPHVAVDSFFSALVVAAFLALLNVTIKPLLILFTIPITLMTLGLFLLVINALVIGLVDSVVSGFTVNGFWWALLFSLILSAITSILEGISGFRKEEPTNRHY
ncbi:MAG: phage holin family protein [Flavobacteriales bacterium]|nr:phage holin family protein [Flavobacteriales bacterium]